MQGRQQSAHWRILEKKKKSFTSVYFTHRIPWDYMGVDSTETKYWWVLSSSFLLVFKAHQDQKAHRLKVLEFFKRNVGFHHFNFALKFNDRSSRCGWIDPNTDSDTTVGIGISIPSWWDQYLTFSTSTAANFPLFYQRTDIFVQTHKLHLHLLMDTLCRHVTCESSSQRDTTDNGRETSGAQCGVILLQWALCYMKLHKRNSKMCQYRRYRTWIYWYWLKTKLSRTAHM